MSVRDNRDGTITVIDDRTGEEKVFEKGSGEQISGPGAPPASTTPINPADRPGAGGGGGCGRAPTQQVPNSQGEIIVALRDWLNGDRRNGLSPNEARRLLAQIGSDPNLVDNEVAAFNSAQQEEQSLGFGGGGGFPGGAGGVTGSEIAPGAGNRRPRTST